MKILEIFTLKLNFKNNIKFESKSQEIRYSLEIWKKKSGIKLSNARKEQNRGIVKEY